MYSNGREEFKNLSTFNIFKESLDIIFKNLFKLLDLILIPSLGILFSILLNVILIYFYISIFNPNFKQDIILSSIICIILSIPGIFLFFKYLSELLISIAALTPLTLDLYRQENIKNNLIYIKSISKNSKKYFKLISMLVLTYIVLMAILILIGILCFPIAILADPIAKSILSLSIPIFALNSNREISYYIKTSIKIINNNIFPFIFVNVYLYIFEFILAFILYLTIKFFLNLFNISNTLNAPTIQIIVSILDFFAKPIIATLFYKKYEEIENQ